MRNLTLLVACLLALAAVLWLERPAALGDAGGWWAWADRTAPAAAAWRAGLMGTAAASTAGGAAPAAKKAPALVATQAAEQKPLDITIDGVGTVLPIASIVVKPRTDSQVAEVPVAEGAAVKQGDLIFKLDDAALKAQLTQADAQIAKDQAQLDQNKRDLARNQDLLKQHFIAPQVLETSQTAYNQTQAQIAVDQALRNGIVTSLGYTEIRASVSGRIGSIAAKVGAAVKSGDTLATLNQIDPIYVAFSVPQDKLSDVRAAMAAGRDQVRLKDNPSAPAGRVAFVENAVDTTTGTIGIKALMPNKSEALWPGAFANVTLVTGTEPNALVVPADAVQIGQNGSFVFVIKDSHAVLVPVMLERVAGDQAVIASGLQAGDQVVIQGEMALTNGAEVMLGKPAAPASDKSKDAKAASQG